MTVIEVIWGEQRSQQAIAKNSRLKRVTDMGVVSSACLVKTHRLICNITYSGQHVTPCGLDLRSNIDLIVQAMFRAYVSMRLDERNRKEDGARIRPLDFL